MSHGLENREVWTTNDEFNDSRGKLVNNNNIVGKFQSDPEVPSETSSTSSPPFNMKKVPNLVRQFLAEFLGTFLLVLFGDGSIAQYKFLEPENQRNFLSVCFGYGFALMIGILVSGNVSGGHLNPAVTLSMACIKKCKWICVPVYWCAQYLGALLGAAVLYGIYADGINANGGKEPNAGIFSSFPNENASTATLVVDQALGTACLLIIILAVTDKKNMNVSSGLIPLLIGLGLAAIHISLAYNAGCAINPARDFSPRLLTLIAGFGNEVFTTANSFFWIPWVMPHVGGVIGALIYFFMVEMHHRDDMD